MEQPEKRFRMIGTFLCLDLVNTRAMRQGQLMDSLASFADLVAWLEAAGAIDGEQARRADRKWGGTPQAEHVLAAALELRDALTRMANALAGGSPPDSRVVAEIDRILAQRPGRWLLEQTGGGVRRRFQPLSAEAIHLLAPVAESAADLLEHGDLRLVKKCENPVCIQYFYDTTKNHSRRWCAMDACGGQQKAAAYYRRTRGKRLESAVGDAPLAAEAPATNQRERSADQKAGVDA